MSVVEAMLVAFIIGYIGANAWIWHASRHDWDCGAPRFFGLILFGPIFGIIVCLAFVFTFTSDTIVFCSRVESIGGCSRSGECGVLLENGARRVMNKPTLGETLCEHTREWR